MKIVISILFAFVCFIGAYKSILGPDFVNPYRSVCEFVAIKIYKADQEIADWKKLCLHRSQLVKPWSSKTVIIKDISNTLQILKMSHLEIYEPQQTQSIWRGVAQETGIESEFVDGELVVFLIHQHSPAAEAGLRYGDIIVSHNKDHPNPWRVRDTAGSLVYRRGSVENKIQLQTREVKRNERVQVNRLKPQVWQIRVPSFRREFFEQNSLLSYKNELQKATLLVIDLRGNQGGNFVAGLKFLSNFLCTPQEVGRLIKPRTKNNTVTVIPESLDDLQQLASFDTVHALILKTFQSSLCLHTPIKVLVDSKTASVAELVAQALRERRGASVLGSTSSGQLLVGVWYPLDELGEGVQISIPQAMYESLEGHRIEGRGVELDKVLYYNLDEMQKGKDPWLEMLLRERI